MSRELPNRQAGFRKGKGTRDQIASIPWIIKKANNFREKKKKKQTSTSASLIMRKTLTLRSQQIVEYFQRDGNTSSPYLTPEKPVCRSRNNS